MEFEGKTVLITGATSGIGRESALQFARRGAQVVIAGRRESEGTQVVGEIQSAGGQALFVQTDVANEDQVRHLVDQTLEHFGRLDVAFNNAGVEHTGPIIEATPDDYRRVFDINVLGVLLSMKYEAPAMLASGGGSIINTSSIAGHIGLPGTSIYVATKHAVEGLTKTAALEWAEQGIRVNAVAPAAIETAMVDRFAGTDEESRAQMAAMHPVGRMGQAAEVASAVLYLASADATFTTGASLPVDGGFLSR